MKTRKNLINVAKFDSHGNYVTNYDGGYLSQPAGIAVNSAGDVYVSNTTNIVEFVHDGSVQEHTPFLAGATLIGLELDASGNLWDVDNFNGEADEYNSNWGLLNFVQFNNPDYQVHPDYLAFDQSGHLWETDWQAGDMEEYDMNRNGNQ